MPAVYHILGPGSKPFRPGAARAWPERVSLSMHYTAAEAARALKLLLLTAALFTIAYLTLHVALAGATVGPARPLFDLDADISLPAWFSSIQLFLIAAVLFLAARQNQVPEQVPTRALYAGSLGFLFLSADEGAAIHEKVTAVARMMELDDLLFRGVHGGWIWLYAILALVILVAVARPLFRLWRHRPREARIGLTGALVFAAGAVVLEVLGYLYLRDDLARPGYKLQVAGEEFLEMAGASIILYGALLLGLSVGTRETPPGRGAIQARQRAADYTGEPIPGSQR